MDLLIQHHPFNGTQLCLEEDPEIFFPETYDDIEAVEKAKAVCKDCWMLDTCFDYALPIVDLDGIWAATTPKERKELRNERHQ